MQSSALPLGEQIALFLFLPPIGSCLWWLFSRVTATMFQGGSISETTKRREKIGFMLGIKIYSIFAR
jgi:hypothetical protein